MANVSKIKLILLIALLLSACAASNETSFIPIKIGKGKAISSYDKGYIYIYGETILVKNPPTDTQAIKDMMWRYRQQNGVKLDDIDTQLYGMSFYQYTPETAYFIDHEEKKDWMGNTTQLGDYKKEFLGQVFSRRCEKDSTYTQWFTTVGRNYERSTDFYWLEQDTITSCP
jgi:hypothetical protein